jgi:PAS domain S-box-containing protein
VAINRLGRDEGSVLIAIFETIAQPTADNALSPQAAVAEAHQEADPEAVSVSSPPSEPVTPAPPVERRHPLRFVWQIDQDGGFTLNSDEFTALIGPCTAAALGRSWSGMASDLGLDPEAQVTRALATRDTWSGLTVTWPVDDGRERLNVELSGLPVFDRDRIYRGYRGFGVCRDLARLAALEQRAQARQAAAATAADAANAPPEPEEIAHEVAPDPQPPDIATPPAEAPPSTRHAENIVPFRPAAPEPVTPALSAIERSVFRELSRKLSQRLMAAGIERKDVLHALEEDDAVGIESAISAVSSSGTPPILDKLPVGILIYRLDQLLYANSVFLAWSGHSSLAALADAGGLDGLFVEPESTAGAGTASGGRTLTLSVDRGDRMSVESELIDIQWEGEPAHALVTAAPGAERAKLVQAQAETAELRSILDTATDGVVILDRRGVAISANRSAQALFGYDAHEFSGRAFADLFAPESARVAHDYLDGLVRDGVAGLINGGREVVGRVRQGGELKLFMTMGRIGDDADKLCAVFRDITPWKKSEEELIAAKRQAEKASSAKSDFLAKISHEIRTPLNAIIGFSEVMMEERFGPVGNDRYREYLKDIHASGGHLLSLINDLLDLSKIEAGKLELTFSSVALNDLTQQCVAIMQPQANRERIIIRTSLPPTLPQVVADARSVRQIVLNLLSNSIKFTGAGGQVIVSTALNDNGEVVLRVRDTGAGMSESDIVTALEPFRQLATTAPGGTGLGLPLTKALAEANRARFHIRSVPKEGTLVEVAFPPTRVLAG